MDLGVSTFRVASLFLGTISKSIFNSWDLGIETTRLSLLSVVGVPWRPCLPQIKIECIELGRAICIDAHTSPEKAWGSVGRGTCWASVKTNIFESWSTDATAVLLVMITTSTLNEEASCLMATSTRLKLDSWIDLERIAVNHNLEHKSALEWLEYKPDV